jgi:hypothetical protein
VEVERVAVARLQRVDAELLLRDGGEPLVDRRLLLLGRFLFVVCIVVLRVDRIAIQASVRAPSKVIP